MLGWLAKLLTPPGGTILDPFAGSASCGLAAVNLGFNYVGIEREGDFHKIGLVRLAHAEGRTGLFSDTD